LSRCRRTSRTRIPCPSSGGRAAPGDRRWARRERQRGRHRAGDGAGSNEERPAGLRDGRNRQPHRHARGASSSPARRGLARPPRHKVMSRGAWHKKQRDHRSSFSFSACRSSRL
jgi:hypothetical protein